MQCSTNHVSRFRLGSLLVVFVLTGNVSAQKIKWEVVEVPDYTFFVPDEISDLPPRNKSKLTRNQYDNRQKSIDKYKKAARGWYDDILVIQPGTKAPWEGLPANDPGSKGNARGRNTKDRDTSATTKATGTLDWDTNFSTTNGDTSRTSNPPRLTSGDQDRMNYQPRQRYTPKKKAQELRSSTNNPFSSVINALR